MEVSHKQSTSLELFPLLLGSSCIMQYFKMRCGDKSDEEPVLKSA